jgi:hypothetical protein
MYTIRVGLVLLLAFAANAYAASSSEVLLDKINPAWQRLDTLSQGYLTDEQQKAIQELAFATAAGEICKGFAVDRTKFVDAFKIFADKKFNAMSADDQRQQERKILVLYGMATGLFSAEGLLAQKDFCASAETVRQQPAGRFWEQKG